jgi:hypothetical protein
MGSFNILFDYAIEQRRPAPFYPQIRDLFYPAERLPDYGFGDDLRVFEI